MNKADVRDCLIVHVPKFQNRYRPLGDYTTTQWMSLGIFALADALRKAGLTSRILHLGLEKNLDPRFTLGKYLAAHPSRVVAFSLQFHQQLHDTLRAARAVKEENPSTYVVLGGMTASFFAGEILAQHPAVDAVIRGEGELPLRKLVGAVASGNRDLASVENLTWRRGNEVVVNRGVYVASADDLGALDMCDLSLMEHHERYVGMPKIFTRLALPAGLRWRVSRLLSQKERRIFFALPVGRGCVTNCFYCGGGSSAHRLINARTRPIFRSREKVLESIRQLIRHGYEGTYVSFDPLPESDAYYRSLFDAMRAEGLTFAFIFSSWSVPSREFLEGFSAALEPFSYINISPETGSERLRKRARGVFFSNEQLMEALRCAEEKRVRTLVYFSMGIPGETREDFEETLRLKKRIEKEFRYAKTDTFAIEIEPASPWHLDPERYGITLFRRRLADFLREQGDPSYSTMTSLGYYKGEYLGRPTRTPREYARSVLRSKCRYFCAQRRICRIAGAFWWCARLLRLVPGGDVRI